MTETLQAKTPDHQYSVALRMTGEDLDPQTITETLRIPPVQSWKKGEDPRPRSKTAGWEYRLEPRAARFWNSLDQGLTALLDVLEPRRDAIRKLAAVHNAFWWIGHFQTSFDGGPLLSPRTLQRIGEFGIGLYIDNYFSPAEDESNGNEDRNSTR